MKKIILLLGLSLVSLGALSFDELMICNEIGVRNEFENKKLALVDNIYSSSYQNISKKADKKDEKRF